MRKLFWLALALGTAELFKRTAAKRGLTPTAFLSNLASNAFGHTKPSEAPPPPSK